MEVKLFVFGHFHHATHAGWRISTTHPQDESLVACVRGERLDHLRGLEKISLVVMTESYRDRENVEWHAKLMDDLIVHEPTLVWL